MRIYILLSLAIFCFTLQSNAQLKAGNRKFERLAYVSAAKKYERATKRNEASVEAWIKLGDCYRLMGDYVSAERTYSKIVNGPVEPIVYLYYAEALMQNEKYGEAKPWLEKYRASVPADERAFNLLSGIEQLPGLKTMEGVYKVSKTNVNSSESDFAPVIYNGGIVFSSNRNIPSWIKKTHSWTGKHFYRLYHAKGQDATFQRATEFATTLKTKLNDGPVSFSKVGTQIYFTRNNIEEGKVQKDEKNITRLKIFHSNFSDGDWGIEVSFPYNSNDYSCAHPSLSVDGKTLYFTSDMPGGNGGMDIWKCEWTGTSWGTPVNLGPDINTKGHEVFPCFASDGTLYFSSDGLPGIGGLDLFYSDKNKGGKPQNMGLPMNSAGDDFGISLGSSNETGYFTSNRKTSFGNDDIYYFTKKCVNVEVIVKDETTEQLLPNTEVMIMENGAQMQVLSTDSTAKFSACLNPLRSYEFIAKREDYTESKATVSNAEMTEAAKSGNKQVNVVLKKNVVNVSGKVYNTDTKEPKMNIPVTLLNRTTKEELVAYTDNTGNYMFNGIGLNNEYELRTSFQDCGEAKERFNTKNVVGEKLISYNLELLCKGAIIEIENIYYDYNKSDIRPDAAIELDKVVEVMNQHPGMKIEIRSHTDARGKDVYNLKLSDGRAKSAVAYIISKGIDTNRLVGKGYGETELLNHCKNDVECSEEEHEVNRRTEFKILEM